MPRVAALYRYPVKGFTPEPRESLTVLPNGRVAGDRVLAFRYADAPAPNDEGWMPKTNYAVLANTPGIAKAKLRFDEAAGHLRIEFPDGRVVEEGLDAEGRQRLAQAVGSFAIAQRDSPLHGHPEKLPLKLVGGLNGEHFHDTAAGRVTLFSRASLGALRGALDDPDLDERRFRANIVIEGVDEWAELAWVGKKVRTEPAPEGRGLSAVRQAQGLGQADQGSPLPPGDGWPLAGAGEGRHQSPLRAGDGCPPPAGAGAGERSPARSVEFEVVKTIGRCVATHANPATGERDRDILNTLTRVFGHEKPTFAVSMQAVSGGEIRTGDQVNLVREAR